jgi:hypothetical protein
MVFLYIVPLDPVPKGGDCGVLSVRKGDEAKFIPFARVLSTW